ncbi:MAG: biopolymer transporter ExbD [Syntrophales bacterium]|jgi:biopolymer transport protein ExbD|nr:biopolymer transporter ExbD [Syntrophales bacterium]
MEHKPIDYINVIPFVDIMLVLLTIVLTTSSFIASGMLPLDLPTSDNRESSILKTQVIEIDKAGRIYTNGMPGTLVEMQATLSSLCRKAPILIRADRTVDLQCFVDVLDAIKMMRFEKVSLQTMEKT